jgi:16S rRNA (cytosine967-C5)-methyltransferase
VDVEALTAALNGGLADVVLVDAPCSSLGAMRRGPNVRWEMSPQVLDVFPPLQLSLLQVAAKFVKPGGVLVYATCTFSTAEGSEIVAAFQHEDFSLEALPFPEAENQSCFIFWPHRHETDGFFLARWRRRT